MYNEIYFAGFDNEWQNPVRPIASIPFQARERLSRQLEDASVRLLEKGSYKNATASELRPDLAIQYGASKLCRVEIDGGQVHVRAGPLEYPEVPIPDQFSVSSVYGGSVAQPYSHGEADHVASAEKDFTYKTVIEKVLSAFPFQAVVNPSNLVGRIAGEKGVRDVVLSIEDDAILGQQTKMYRRMGFRVTQKSSGLAFLGMSGDELSDLADQWISLIPMPTKDGWDAEGVELRFQRKDYSRTGRLKFTHDPSFFIGPEQMFDLFGVRNWVLQSSHPLETWNVKVPDTDACFGRWSFLDDYPPLVQEADGWYRKKGDKYYDYYGPCTGLFPESPYLSYPYSVRRGVLKRLGKKLAEPQPMGPFVWGIFSIVVRDWNAEPHSHLWAEGHFSMHYQKAGLLWSSTPFVGSEWTSYGFVKRVRYDVQSPYVVEHPYDPTLSFFRSVEELNMAMQKFATFYEGESPLYLTAMAKKAYQLGCTGQKFEVSDSSLFVRQWRQFPMAFCDGPGNCVLLRSSLDLINRGSKYRLIYMPFLTSIDAPAARILRSSGFDVSASKHGYVLYDLMAVTSRIAYDGSSSISFTPYVPEEIVYSEDFVPDSSCFFCLQTECQCKKTVTSSTPINDEEVVYTYLRDHRGYHDFNSLRKVLGWDRTRDKFLDRLLRSLQKQGFIHGKKEGYAAAVVPKKDTSPQPLD